MNNKQIHIYISGRVQGVFFRKFVKNKADQLGLTGFTQNLTDGRVEVVAQGKEESLYDLVRFCQIGSKGSDVKEVEIINEIPEFTFDTFELIRSGNYIRDKIKAAKNLAQNIVKDKIIPKHVVIIPDGNRRWAKKQGLEVWKGHEKGRKNAEDLLSHIKESGVKFLTMWGFSTENWKRSEIEVKQLMKIFEKMIDDLKDRVNEEKIRFYHFGRKDRLPKKLLQKIEDLEEKTKNYTDFSFGLALDYGGRDELIRAFEKIQDYDGQIDEEVINNVVDSSDFPDPDLIIRTGGEQRLSGMMPWQSIYAEILFSSKLFPQFSKEDFTLALQTFANRKRRFGK